MTRRLTALAAWAASLTLGILSLSGCAFLGNDPVVPTADAPTVPAPVNPTSGPTNDGGATPPQGITLDGGPGAAAYLGCRAKAIDSGVANAGNIGTVDAACVAQSQAAQ